MLECWGDFLSLDLQQKPEDIVGMKIHNDNIGEFYWRPNDRKSPQYFLSHDFQQKPADIIDVKIHNNNKKEYRGECWSSEEACCHLISTISYYLTTTYYYWWTIWQWIKKYFLRNLNFETNLNIEYSQGLMKNKK